MATKRPEAAALLEGLSSEIFAPRGFKKSAQVFSKAFTGYVVRFQIQGSAWNNSKSPWRFYLNVGIEFPNSPEARMYPAPFAIHSLTRGGVSALARDHYHVADGSVGPVVAEIGKVVDDTLAYFEANHLALEQAFATRRPNGFLYFLDPEIAKLHPPQAEPEGLFTKIRRLFSKK